MGDMEDGSMGYTEGSRRLLTERTQRKDCLQKEGDSTV
jgi:hypothetical protein